MHRREFTVHTRGREFCEITRDLAAVAQGSGVLEGLCSVFVPHTSASLLPVENWDRIFVPFQRLGDTDNTTGVGLGLALSRGLTEAMGGTLEPEETPGGGLTMTLSLPAAPGPVSPLP
jgi:light-regulated signal transduction histidine kinase (bacteriophytochrome)